MAMLIIDTLRYTIQLYIHICTVIAIVPITELANA